MSPLAEVGPSPVMLEADTRRVPLAGAADIARHISFALLSLAMVGPIVWVALLSFRTRREITTAPFALPTHFDFGNYVAVFHEPDVLVFLVNSLVTVSGALAIVLVASTMAAYAIARIDFPGRQVLFIVFLIGDSIPLIVIIVPLFIIVQRLGLAGSRWAVILPYAAMNLGVSVYVLRGFFRSIPSDIEDAARLDGCNLPQMLLYVILPMARPGLIVVAIINFISFWNEFFLATVLATSQQLLTLPAGLAATLVNKHETNWPVMSAAVVLTLIPLLVLFLATQDKITRGWTASVR